MILAGVARRRSLKEAWHLVAAFGEGNHGKGVLGLVELEVDDPWPRAGLDEG